MNGVGDSSIVSETSSDGESSRGTPAKKKGPSSYFAAASVMPQSFMNPDVIRNRQILSQSLTGGVAHQQKTFTNDNSGDLRTDVSQSGGGRPLEHGGSRSVSDTSSTVSVSSSSTEEAFSQSLLPSRASLPWESIMASQSALPAGTSPSLTGSAIRELLSVNLPEEQYPPGLPPSPGRGFSLMSPKSLKNRPQIAIDCPDEIRRRTRSDSLALEVRSVIQSIDLIQLAYHTLLMHTSDGRGSSGDSSRLPRDPQGRQKARGWRKRHHAADHTAIALSGILVDGFVR